MEYSDFFRKAVGLRTQSPHAYQVALAQEPLVDRVIRVPTGGGKTAAACLAWLYKLSSGNSATPRRLVFVLPMRSLVRQVCREIRGWLRNLGLEQTIQLFELLGGDPLLRPNQRAWIEFPEATCIIVGTVDLVLSAALNRGYAMSRFRWPVAFGLLHNDALWVIDETQLMGNAVSTIAQITAFRKTYGVCRPVFTWWMSATHDPSWLRTIDSPHPLALFPQSENIDRLRSDLGARYAAAKPLAKLKSLTPSEVLAHHRPGTLTLIVCNTVQRARELMRELQTAQSSPKSTKRVKSKAKPDGTPELLLLHSRFRMRDRENLGEHLRALDAALRGKETELSDAFIELLRRNGQIVVATQVVEAGLDISAETLITEVAPWSSLVQRFGRLNREGLQPGARAFWTDTKDPEPYTKQQLADSRTKLQALENVSPASLDRVALPEPPPADALIRQQDFHSLFSTERDLAGGFADVSRFIRDNEERTVYVYWREFSGSPAETEPTPEELCPVPLYARSDGLIEFLQSTPGWSWDDSARRWSRIFASEVVAGMTVLLAKSGGGYSSALGWTAAPGDKPEACNLDVGPATEPDADGSDRYSETNWHTLSAHLAEARAEAQRLASALELSPEWTAALVLAAEWHDAGKAHSRWQGAVQNYSQAEWRPGTWAKFPCYPNRRFRPRFRHEEASALLGLAFLASGQPGWSPLAVYLIACHHGKVRTSLGLVGDLRLWPKESIVLEGKVEGPMELPTEYMAFTPPARWLDEETVEIAGTSWTELIFGLVGGPDRTTAGSLGPFRLAFLEALMVAADVRATKQGGLRLA